MAGVAMNMGRFACNCAIILMKKNILGANLNEVIEVGLNSAGWEKLETLEFSLKEMMSSAK